MVYLTAIVTWLADTRLGRYVSILGAALAAFWLVHRKGVRDGKDAVVKKVLEHEEDIVSAIRAVEGSTTADEARDKLRKKDLVK